MKVEDYHMHKLYLLAKSAFYNQYTIEQPYCIQPNKELDGKFVAKH